jgi:protoheme IX farnesyltransferase
LATTNNQITSIGSFLKQKITDYKLLVKFRLSLLVVFSACITFALGASFITWQAMLILGVGGFLITGAANALNQVLEKEYDKLMSRTANRPLAAGRMEVQEAVLMAGLMTVGGILLLSAFNPQTAVLGALSLVSYAFVYTPMKRVSPAAVWIGAIPGALPMAIGWVAATGTLGNEAIFLFGLQFFWQFPHFWAIAWVAYKDYANGGFFLLPSKKEDGRDKSTALQTVFYALCLLPMSILPYYLDISGYIACSIMFFSGVVYTWYAINLYLKCTDKAARKLMFASFVYLPIVLLSLVFDKI